MGDGHWRETFLAKVKEFGLDNRVYWIPRVRDEDVPYYINAMDVLLLPSETMSNWKEQFGRVLVEAMACGVPCIGSDSGAISEVLGEAGLIFSERDCSELAEAIKKLMADSGLYQSLRERGMERARKYFSCEAYAANLVSMYNEVLEIRSWDKKRMQGLKISG